MVHQYFIKTPWLIKKLFPSYVWCIPSREKTLYLTFDDGPHPAITPFVLNLLKEYKALATFFCIGENIVKYPQVYAETLRNGHAVGNHTYRHLNGWKTGTETYLEDVHDASKYIQSKLFRPPYGKIRNSQAKGISMASGQKTHIIMWDVLSADFDTNTSPEQCLSNVLKNVEGGSIIVFHDSQKAFKNLKYVLPEVLKILSGRGFRFEKIKEELL